VGGEGRYSKDKEVWWAQVFLTLSLSLTFSKEIVDSLHSAQEIYGETGILCLFLPY
jgi:hypothetical protein